MTSTALSSPHIAASDVHSSLQKHILVDGFRMVADLERSHGAHLHDALAGRDILDLFTSFSTSPLGYNHPGLTTPEFKQRVLIPAINKPANSDLYTSLMAEFVETFSRTLPEELAGNLFFISGGSLAVENALKTAFDWKTKKNQAAGRSEMGDQIIHFRHAFHGRSGYTLSLTNTDPAKTDAFPKFEWPRATNPHLSFPATDEVLAHTQKMERQSIEEIKQALIDHPHRIAGLIIEPIQGEGGDNHFRREFLERLRTLADENEFLLIFDEVQTGFGSTGKWWCLEHFGVMPDVIAFGKKTQVCGIAATERVNEVESVFRVSSRINSTWGGNLVDMVRCQRIVEIIEEDDLLARATHVGEKLVLLLRQLEEAFPGKVTNARGRGLFLAFDLPSKAVRDQALSLLLDSNVLGLSSGDSSIRFRPPLILSEEEASEGVSRVQTALEKLL